MYGAFVSYHAKEMCAGIKLYILQHAKYCDFKVKVKGSRITCKFPNNPLFVHL